MAILWPLDLEVVASLLHLRFSLITFMGQFYFIYCSRIFYICGQKLLHLWLVLYLWVIQKRLYLLCTKAIVSSLSLLLNTVRSQLGGNRHTFPSQIVIEVWHRNKAIFC